MDMEDYSADSGLAPIEKATMPVTQIPKWQKRCDDHAAGVVFTDTQGNKKARRG
jgi:hypothetical protein